MGTETFWYQYYLKYLILCFTEERNEGHLWGQVNDDIIFIFDYPFKCLRCYFFLLFFLELLGEAP